jgi:hypothetical protein
MDAWRRNQKSNILELVQDIHHDPTANLCAEILLSNLIDAESCLVVASTPMQVL